MSTAPPTPSDGSPSMVSRKVGAGIQARLARLQGATGAPVIAREVPKRFPSGYDDPFRERLDGTLRRSMSGTWSVHTLEAEASGTSTDGSHTLVESQPNTALPTVSEDAELKRRRDFTKNWEKQQQAVADQLLTPEPSRIQSSPQPIIEEPEPEEEPVKNGPPPAVVEPEKKVEPEQKDPKHGILTPPISEPESKPARKSEPKRVARPPTTPSTSRLRAPPASAPAPAPRTPPRTRPRASAPAASSSTLGLPAPRVQLTPSPARIAKSSSLAPPRPHTSMTARRTSAPEARRLFSSKVPAKVLPPPVRPRTISKVYEGPTVSSLAKQRPSLNAGTMSRAVSRTSFL